MSEHQHEHDGQCMPPDILAAIKAAQAEEDHSTCEGVHVFGITPDGAVKDLTPEVNQNTRELRAYRAATEATISVALEDWPLEQPTTEGEQAFLTCGSITALFETMCHQPSASLFVLTAMTAEALKSVVEGDLVIDCGLEVDDRYRCGDGAHQRMLTWSLLLAEGSQRAIETVKEQLAVFIVMCMATGHTGAHKNSEQIVAGMDFLKQVAAGRVTAKVHAPGSF